MISILARFSFHRLGLRINKLFWQVVSVSQETEMRNVWHYFGSYKRFWDRTIMSSLDSPHLPKTALCSVCFVLLRWKPWNFGSPLMSCFGFLGTEALWSFWSKQTKFSPLPRILTNPHNRLRHKLKHKQGRLQEFISMAAKTQRKFWYYFCIPQST